MQKTELPK